MTKRVLITGGAGFFGVPLAEGLLSRSYNVKIIDIEDIPSTALKSRVEFIKGDIRNRGLVDLSCQNIDYVIHNAAILPISRSKRKIFWQVNVEGTRNTLSAALHNKVKKVVFISSSAPYGIPQALPINEDTPFNPVCDYGRSKIEAEKICNEYRGKGLDIVIIRPRTIVGQGRLGLFQILYSWIADNKNIYIIGQGDNLFQLLSERDLVDACVLTLEKECTNQNFNVGADRYKTVREDLQALIDYAQRSSKIISLPPGPTKIFLALLDKCNLAPFTPWHYKTPDKTFYFDTTKAKQSLGWIPQMSNLDMLKNSYDWYCAHRNTVDSSFGITHRKAVKQKILRILKKLS